VGKPELHVASSYARRFASVQRFDVESLLLVLEGTGAFGIRLAGIRLVAAEGRNS
jgi:hypothetical protein